MHSEPRLEGFRKSGGIGGPNKNYFKPRMEDFLKPRSTLG